MTTNLNKLSVKVDVEDKDNTTFGLGGWKSRVGGLRDVEADLAGFWQSAMSGAVDSEVFPNLGTADRVVTVSPTGAAADTAYMFQAGEFSYELLGQIGEVTLFTLAA